jgi:hypothetical protein
VKIDPTDYIASLRSEKYEGKDPDLDQYIAWLKDYILWIHRKHGRLAKESLAQANYYRGRYEANSPAGDPPAL